MKFWFTSLYTVFILLFFLHIQNTNTQSFTLISVSKVIRGGKTKTESMCAVFIMQLVNNIQSLLLWLLFLSKVHVPWISRQIRQSVLKYFEIFCRVTYDLGITTPTLNMAKYQSRWFFISEGMIVRPEKKLSWTRCINILFDIIRPCTIQTNKFKCVLLLTTCLVLTCRCFVNIILYIIQNGWANNWIWPVVMVGIDVFGSYLDFRDQKCLQML